MELCLWTCGRFVSIQRSERDLKSFGCASSFRADLCNFFLCADKLLSPVLLGLLAFGRLEVVVPVLPRRLAVRFFFFFCCGTGDGDTETAEGGTSRSTISLLAGQSSVLVVSLHVRSVSSNSSLSKTCTSTDGYMSSYPPACDTMLRLPSVVALNPETRRNNSRMELLRFVVDRDEAVLRLRLLWYLGKIDTLSLRVRPIIVNFMVLRFFLYVQQTPEF